MLLNELEDPEKSAPEKVEWEDDGPGHKETHFDAGGESYQASFIKWWFQPENTSVGFDCWDINLRQQSGSNTFALSGESKNPHEVYGKFNGIVFAFIRDFKPQAVSFSPFDPKMSVMYKIFYDKYLSKMYTLVQSAASSHMTKRVFLRNDLFQKHKDEVGFDSDKLRAHWGKEVEGLRKSKVEKRSLTSKVKLEAEKKTAKQITGTFPWTYKGGYVDLYAPMWKSMGGSLDIGGRSGYKTVVLLGSEEQKLGDMPNIRIVFLDIDASGYLSVKSANALPSEARRAMKMTSPASKQKMDAAMKNMDDTKIARQAQDRLWSLPMDIPIANIPWQREAPGLAVPQYECASFKEWLRRHEHQS